MCRVVEGARAVDGQEKCLEDQILADVFGLESAMTTDGLCSLVLYYDHIKSITRKTQPLYIYMLCLLWWRCVSLRCHADSVVMEWR